MHRITRTLALAGLAGLLASAAQAQVFVNGAPATVNGVTQFVWNGQNISASNPLPVNVVAGGGGGTGATANAASTSNATDGQTTSTTNQQNVTYNYLYNGATWDRARGVGGAANVLVGGTLPAYAATPTFNLGTLNGAATAANQNVTAAGTSATSAQAVQGVTGGVPQNVTGTVNDIPTASTAAVGPAPVTTTTSALVGKASAANLYGFSFTMGATAGFAAILNASAAPATSAAIAPLECVPIAANAYVARRQDIPDRYGTGLVVVATSSCTTYTAVAPVLMSVLVQ